MEEAATTGANGGMKSVLERVKVMKQSVQTAQAPAALGPYSQAIRSGEWVFTSGQIPLDPATGQIVAGGIAEQTARALESLRAVLQAAGSDLVHVVKMTVFLKSMEDFAGMNAVYATYFGVDGSPAPARSTVEVARLPKDVLVEIEAIAAR